MMTEDNEMLIGIEFLMGPGRDVTHRHEDASLDTCSIEFPWLTHINQASSVFAE